MIPWARFVLSSLLLAAMFTFSNTALAQCPKGQAMAGDILSPREQMVPVERAGRAVSVSSLEVLCTGDRVIARDAEVTLLLQWQEAIVTIPQGEHYAVPSKRQVMSDLLAGVASFFFQREARAGESAVTLAPPGLRFAVKGLETGEARLSALPPAFALPISRGRDQALMVRLRDPRGRPYAREAAPGEPTPVFVDLPRLQGTWTIEAESAGQSIRGRFNLSGTRDWQGPRGAEDAILIWICEDPTANSLEGVHELRAANGGAMSQRAQSILTRWNESGSRSFCAGG
jgi:hypothetical protein